MVPRAALAQGGGVIAGQVVDGGSGRPIAAAVVSVSGGEMTVNPSPNQPPQALTGGDGRFVFGNLGAGAYLIRATKGGYADGAAGRRRPGGDSQPVEISAAASSADVVVRMWKYGVITGTVSDEAGEPVVGLPVRLVARVRPGARPAPAVWFVAVARPYAAVGGAIQTDDRGVYRF